ncbi:MAG: 6-phospho-alpha-glucosidase [Cellulosilyticaceae bacterium]
MKNKLVIVGGGASHTPGIIATLGERKDDLKLRELVLYDIDAERVYAMGEFTKIYMRENAPALKVSYTTDINEAFQDADFLFVQIRPGGNEQRGLDEKIPLKHGIVGQETCGVGGFAFAMRNIPAMLEIVKKALEICPDAWILNYSNPEAIISEAVYRAYPEAKMLCICDMPISQELVIAELLQKPHETLTFKYFGLNHFGWFTHIYDQEGVDLMPEFREKVMSGEIPNICEPGSTKKDFLYLARNFKTFKDYLPISYLTYYFYGDEIVELEDKDYTRADYVIEYRESKVFGECHRVIEAGTAKDSDLVSGIHGNYIVDLANAIVNNTRERFVINVMNHGCIANFNHDAVVEVPCYVGAFGIEPVAVGNIPQFHKSMMEVQKGYEKLTVEAALTGSYEKALQAVALNKTVPSMRVAEAVLEDLIEANKGYWTELK